MDQALNVLAVVDSSYARNESQDERQRRRNVRIYRRRRKAAVWVSAGVGRFAGGLRSIHGQMLLAIDGAAGAAYAGLVQRLPAGAAVTRHPSSGRQRRRL